MSELPISATDRPLVRWELRRCVAFIAVEPLLASWDASHWPSQVRLRAYLDLVEAAFAPGIGDGPLALHVDVRMRPGTDLLRYNDLENYLTPLAQRLKLANLVRASATKAHAATGSESRI